MNLEEFLISKAGGLGVGKLLPKSGGIRKTLISNVFLYDFRSDYSVYFQVNGNRVEFRNLLALAYKFNHKPLQTEQEIIEKFRSGVLEIIAYQGFQYAGQVEFCFVETDTAA